MSSNEVYEVLISRDSHLRLRKVEELFPRLFSRLAGAVPMTPERGAITGEGLSLAFQQASVLANALESGALKAFERRHRSSRRRPAFMASLMLKPETFASMLGMHVGAIS